MSYSLSLYSKNIISVDQHGFVSGRSTVSNLVTYTSYLSRQVDSKKQVDSIYTDFTSAFDKVDHEILILKLCAYGICNPLLSWFRSYLSNRVQRVIVKGHTSDPYIATSGVPQGSHLGPILFSLFINDVTRNVRHSFCSLFADDLKLYRTICSIEDSFLLQEDLNSIQEWCTNNRMSLNASKCSHIKFTRKKKVVSSKYFIHNQELLEVSVIRDLGVLIDSKLTYSAHYNHMISKAWALLGLIKRSTLEFKRPDSIVAIFNALVRSVLEYAVPIWNPCYKSHIIRIEKVQRSLTRYLAFKDKSCPFRADYQQRLSHFNLQSLENRRHVADSVTLYKICHSKLDCSDLLSQVNLVVPRLAPRHPLKKIFLTNASKSNLGKFSPINRIINLYNNLSDHNIDIFHDSLIDLKKK